MFKRISVRITTIFIAVTVLVVLITSIIFSFLFRSYTITEQKDTLTLCANEIAQLVSEDKVSSYNYNDRIITDYNLFSKGVLNADIWIVNANGVFDRIKDSSTKAPLNLMELDADKISLIQRAFQGETFETDGFSGYFDEDTLSVLVPIRETQTQQEQELGVIGAVVVHCPIVSINKSFQTASGLLIVSVLIATAVSAVVALFLSTTITHPVRQISSAASQMAAGDYSVKVDIRDKSEIGELGNVLNYLAHTLQLTITELSAEKDKLDDIINNVSDGLASFDKNLTLIKYNAAFLRLCSYEMLEKDEIRGCLLRATETGTQQEYIYENEDILRFVATPLLNEGKVTGIILVVRDISQSERLENTRREFVSNVSHEFRTPLTVIKGSIEMLLDGAVTDPEMLQKTYQRIEGETSALERLVYDLLDVSRLKSGKIVLDYKDVDIEKLGANIVSNMQMIAHKKGVTLTFCASGIPHVWGDIDRLRQLYIIFIDNAIKFTPEGGVVAVSTAIVDKMACIKIRDTGKGIAKKDIPYIFERFYKADKSRGNSAVGTGLGLSIASNIVELHGGGITVESELGQGTEFSIMLPFSKEQNDL